MAQKAPIHPGRTGVATDPEIHSVLEVGPKGPPCHRPLSPCSAEGDSYLDSRAGNELPGPKWFGSAFPMPLGSVQGSRAPLKSFLFLQLRTPASVQPIAHPESPRVDPADTSAPSTAQAPAEKHK